MNATESLPPGIQRLLAESRRRMPRAVAARERRAELIAGGTFVAVAVLIAVLVPTDRSLDWSTAVVATIALGLSSMVVFEVGSVHTYPTQVAFVPMLFVLPTELVPLFVLAGLLIGKLASTFSGQLAPGRVLMAAGDSWFAIGPTLVLIAAGAPSAASAAWYVLLAALASQFAVESVASSVRERLHGERRRRASNSPRAAGSTSSTRCLAPIGLAIAFAAADRSWVLLLPLPLLPAAS